MQNLNFKHLNLHKISNMKNIVHNFNNDILNFSHIFRKKIILPIFLKNIIKSKSSTSFSYSFIFCRKIPYIGFYMSL